MPTALGALGGNYISSSRMSQLFNQKELADNQAVQGAISEAKSMSSFLVTQLPGNMEMERLDERLKSIAVVSGDGGPLSLQSKSSIEGLYDAIYNMVEDSKILNNADVSGQMDAALKNGSGGKIQDFNQLQEEVYNLMLAWAEARNRELEAKRQQAVAQAQSAATQQEAQQAQAQAQSAEQQKIQVPPPKHRGTYRTGLVIGLIAAGVTGVALLLYKKS